MENMNDMKMDVLMSSVIQSANAEYAVQDLVGQGAFSRVYKAIDVNTKESVVIKALNSNGQSDPLAQCIEELNIMYMLGRSPMRTRYVGLKEALQLQTGTYCFVMERLGTTLHTMIRNVGPLPLSMCRPIIRQIVQGLAGLRCMGIVHADLKPDNIMFGAEPDNNYMVKIIDFGWAFQMKDAHVFHGTKFQAVPYRAPEVCIGKDVGYGVDLWSLGCMMSEMVTGTMLFATLDEKYLIELIKSTFTWSDHSSQNTAQPVLTEGCIRFQKLRAIATDERLGDRQKMMDVAWLVDLVYRMLTVEPRDRITAVEALAHPFLTMAHFVDYPSTGSTKRNVEMMDKCMDGLVEENAVWVTLRSGELQEITAGTIIGGRLYFWLKWIDIKEVDLVLAKEVNMMYPQFVIRFYEQIGWKTILNKRGLQIS